MGYDGDLSSKIKINKHIRGIDRSSYNDFKTPFMKDKKSILKTKHEHTTEENKQKKA